MTRSILCVIVNPCFGLRCASESIAGHPVRVGRPAPARATHGPRTPAARVPPLGLAALSPRQAAGVVDFGLGAGISESNSNCHWTTKEEWFLPCSCLARSNLSGTAGKLFRLPSTRRGGSTCFQVSLNLTMVGYQNHLQSTVHCCTVKIHL